ncbi:MAG: HAD family phosphatase [Acidobacteriota bacterium]|nr:HAD family phosphatase [Acidobacteriota bacterium]
MITAIVFDFDGVIADTEKLHLAAFRQALESLTGPDRRTATSPDPLTLSEAEYYEKYLGFDDEGVFRILGAERGVDLGDQRLRELVEEKGRAYERLVAGARSILYPGIEDCIRRFHGTYPLAIASGAYADEIRAVLTPAGLLRYFETIVGAGDTPSGKPAPDPYLEAARRINADPRRCLAIEDSRWGIQSAVAAGMTCIAVTTSYKAHELAGAVIVVPSVERITLELVKDL